MAGDEKNAEDLKNVEETSDEANPGDQRGLASGGQEADDVRQTQEAVRDGHADEVEGNNLWDAPAREAAQSMPLGEGEETVVFPADEVAASGGVQQHQWFPPGGQAGPDGGGSVMANGTRSLERSGEDWERADPPVARQRKPSPTALAVYSWGVESRKGGVREVFTATIEQAEMAKVWSNGDVVISSGGKGTTPAVRVILDIFLRVFKAEIAEVGEEEGGKDGGGWQIEHQTGYKQAFSENMSMSLFANRDWPYIKTKLKRLPTKIFLPKEPNTVRPLAPVPAEQRKQGPYSTAQSGAGRRIAQKERAQKKRGPKGAQSHLPQLGQPRGAGRSKGNGNPSATAFADAAVKEGVPPEIVQQLLKAAGGSAGTIAALAAAAVASAAGGGGSDLSAVAEGSISQMEGVSRNAEGHRMGWRVSPGEAITGNDGYGVNRFDGHGVINVNTNANPPVLTASSISRKRGPAPVAVVSEAVVSSPPHGTEPGLVAAGGANERAELDGSGDYYNIGERRRRRERSWSRSRGSHTGDGAGEADGDVDTREGRRKRPTRSPEGWRPWRPDDDSPTSPQRSRAEETDGGSWRERGRRRRRVEDGRRRTGFDSGGAWGGRGGRGNGGAGGGFNGGYRSSYFGGMGRGRGFGKIDGFRTDDGYGWNDGSDWDGGFGRGAGFGRGNGYGRGGGFGRGSVNGGQSWRSQLPPSRRTGSTAWSPTRNKNAGCHERDRTSRWGGGEHGGNLNPPFQTFGVRRSEKQFVVESLRAGEPGHSVERAKGVDRRDSYDPDQYDPDAYDPGEVTVKRDGDGDGRKQKSTSRSRSPGPGSKRNGDSMANSGTDEEREGWDAKEGFNGSSSPGTVNLSAQPSTQSRLSVKGDRGFDVGGISKGDGNEGTPWVNATRAASIGLQQQQPLGWKSEPQWQQQLLAQQPASSQPQQLTLYALPSGPPQQLPLPQQHQQLLVQHPQVQLHMTQQPQQLHQSLQLQHPQQQPTALAVHNSGGVWLGTSQTSAPSG